MTLQTWSHISWSHETNGLVDSLEGLLGLLVGAVSSNRQ
jgi:hypothetical protein